MKMDYKIEKPQAEGEPFIADAELHWYAQRGHFKVEASGYGDSEEAAKKQASLMLGQARAALTEALIETVPNRVPETSQERPNGPAEHRP